MNKEKELQAATRWQQQPKRTEMCLGDEISKYLRRRQREFEKNTSIVAIWDQVIPPELKPFCRLDRRAGNALCIEVQPGPYMHQVQLLSEELLDRIRQQASQSGIQRIRVIPMKKTAN